MVGAVEPLFVLVAALPVITASEPFRESVKIEKDEDADPEARRHAKLVQYAVIFDRIFRFAITGSRVRNYDGLGGQLLFAWMHQHHVLHWTDSKLSIDWDEAADVVVERGARIEELYWRSIDRPKMAHWLAAYELISGTVTPNPASVWAKGPGAARVLPRVAGRGPVRHPRVDRPAAELRRP